MGGRDIAGKVWSMDGREIPYACKLSRDETFADLVDRQPCIHTLSPQKFW